ncbi:diguanylate cyclase [Marinomonas sp. 15G1-11]|uniref:diguanylate cyclase n=1 Tax=Marinomonas phaeophyticola TaxID=3004091 RepID=A0ABT4JZ62_9GAMM|nr:sensor domain-containing diguanylate cyclase [Marinomonas sp. 15G1-11]MCZ2723668.1 diguanylate cyclase [Marinomonas sp. 15G1-11]
MSDTSNELFELHWLFDMLHNIDVGLVVLDTNYEIQLWNSFMENHSGMSSITAKNTSLFSVFPDLNAEWLQKKLDHVVALRTPIFISWEQRPFLFSFKSYRPITGIAEKMFQNVTIRPLSHIDGSIKYVCLVIYDVTDVATNKAALSAANRKLHIMSTTDDLTGLKNRNSLDKALEMVFESYKRAPTSAHSLVMADLDLFKKINDRYGHQTGDLVLKEVSSILSSSSRKGDFVGRFGGEEFAILLPNCDEESALIYCEKIREKIQNLVVKSPKGDIKITISLGISQLNEKDLSVDTWLSKADDALYQAKEKGRNQTLVYK